MLVGLVFPRLLGEFSMHIPLTYQQKSALLSCTILRALNLSTNISMNQVNVGRYTGLSLVEIFWHRSQKRIRTLINLIVIFSPVDLREDFKLISRVIRDSGPVF